MTYSLSLKVVNRRLIIKPLTIYLTLSSVMPKVLFSIKMLPITSYSKVPKTLNKMFTDSLNFVKEFDAVSE